MAPTSAYRSAAETEKMNQFNRLEQFAKLQNPPAIKFKDLEAAVNSRISYNILPMKVRADFFPLTEASVLTNITMQFDNKDLQFQAKDGVQKAVGQHLRQGHHHDAPHRDQLRGHGGSHQPAGISAADRAAQVDLQEERAAGAGHVPVERGGQGRGRRQPEQLRNGPGRAPHGRRRSCRPATSCWPT